jgi:hypothetical protein
VNTVGLSELGAFAQAVDHERWSSIGINRKLISLEKLVSMYLTKPLKKGVATSLNWEEEHLSAVAKQCIHPKTLPGVDNRCGE